jgi:DNA-binding CsgD family transcriptional regulator/tetratricopeptide (TPR) repeat protein
MCRREERGEVAATVASGEPPKLVGRGVELGRLTELLDGARKGTTGAVVVLGEAGIGKTTLLDAVAARADGFLRLRARGIESEEALGHAALLELLQPVRDRLPKLSTSQATSLAAALGWADPDASGERYLVAAATLSLLAAAADEAPVLVVIDDLQWLDDESAAALLFAARRTHHDRIAFVLASRPEVADRRLDGLDRLDLTGLSTADATSMLADDVADGDRLGRSVVDALVHQVRGNPLGLLEAAANLTAAQRRGAAPLPEPLPVGPRLERIFDASVQRLSSGARRAALVLAVAEDGGTSHLTAALGLDDVDAAAALDELESQRIVVRDGDDAAFRHPLLRSSVWRSATPQQRRGAHRALAATARTGDAFTRAWHLAHAAEGPDDGLADDLEAAAKVARTRQGYATSSRLLERAAALTADAAAASDRLASAAEDSFVGGDVERARALAEGVLAVDAPGPTRGAVLYTLGMIEQHAGSVPAALQLLERAGEVAEGATRIRALSELASTQFRMNRIPDVIATAATITATADPADPEQQAVAELLGGVASVIAGGAEDGRRLIRRSAARFRSDPVLRDDPRFLLHELIAATFSGDAGGLRLQVERRLHLARERGALGVLAPALTLVAYGRMFSDDHDGAFADAGEAVELAHELGLVAEVAPAAELLALQSAFRGLFDDARRALDLATATVERAGTAAVAAHLAIAEAYDAVCRGDLAAVVRRLEPRLAVDGGEGAMGEPLGIAPLLVEAYAGLGRQPEAAELAAAYAAAPPVGPPATAALVARCQALATTDDAEATAAFERSLARHAGVPPAFEESRTRLLYGSRLRRSGRRIDAREQLGRARDAFAGWGHAHWADVAEAELRATGATARPRGPVVDEPLTSQETRIAQLVAQGLSNREVAAALFLSPKTVEHHLTTIFRKRGLRSRTELAASFTRGGADET